MADGNNSDATQADVTGGTVQNEVLQYCVYMPSKYIIRLYQRSRQ